jgi:hypothetical protein
VSWLTSPDSDWDPEDPAATPDAFADDYPDSPHEPRSRGKLIFLLVVAWLAVSVLVLVVLLAIGGTHKDNKAGGQPSAPGTSASKPPTSSSLSVPDGWVQQATDDQTNCAAHSYGEVQKFFAKTPCSSVHRMLTSSNQAGRNVVVASYVITFKNQGQAKKFNDLVTSDGTGNVSDLLREGITYPGAPKALPDNAAFASRQDGSRVVVAEAGYVGGTSTPTDPALNAAANKAIQPG